MLLFRPQKRGGGVGEREQRIAGEHGVALSRSEVAQSRLDAFGELRLASSGRDPTEGE